MPYVGILGGTFDPIHNGHLAVAEGLIETCGLDKVLFLPNRQPPHKAGRRVTEAHHRSAMVKLAIADNPRFECWGLELEREGPSYTIDTVRAIQMAGPGCESAFIIGMDSLLDIETWKDYQTLLRLTDIIVVNRPGWDTGAGHKLLDRLGPELSRRVRLITLPGVDVSATELRERAAMGASLRYLVPDSVSAYIREQRLYTP